MSKLPDEVLYDSRLVERHIAQGLLTRKDYEKHLQTLNDSEANADTITLQHMLGPTGEQRGRLRVKDASFKVAPEGQIQKNMMN